MDDKGVLNSQLAMSEDKSDGLCPLFFGVSCAFFALGLLSERELDGEKWSEMRNTLLQGSAHLVGLLVWRVQREEANSGKCDLVKKLQNAEREIDALKKMRREDAKANEKVVGIFAAQEQGWFNQRKKLQQHIGALTNELCILEKKKDEVIGQLNEKLQEKELLVESKDKVLVEDEQKRRELEEKLKTAEYLVDELRESAKHEAQIHSSEVWKHKTAFIQLVSNQRQLEAEMGRAVRQVEAAKRELDSVLEQKEQSVLMAEKLSMEVVKLRKDLEQKDSILSAMLRKSKLDTAEKQMLLKEVKLSKAKKKQAELETERWRAVSESMQERHSLRSMLFKNSNLKQGEHLGGRVMHSSATMSSRRTRSQSTNFLEYEEPEPGKDLELFSPFSDQHLSETSGELVDVKQLESWIRSEAEKYTTNIEQRHHLEIDAFAEQLRLKDEKLEAFRWRLMSMELESKRLQSHIEGLDRDLAQLRQDNLKLEAVLLDREAELHSVKHQLSLHSDLPNCQKTDLNPSLHDRPGAHDTIWSRVKIIKRKPGEIEQEKKITFIDGSQEVDVEREVPTPPPPKDLPVSMGFTVQSPDKEFEVLNDVPLDPGRDREELPSTEEVENAENLLSTSSKKINIPWKLDLHALGVHYKIKRLKQQLLMLEALAGKQESSEDVGNVEGKRLYILMALINKQVSRYQSLQERTDDLCKRMHDNDLDVSPGKSSIARTKEETKLLEHFLEETFQLQRYIVATGQKMMEIQTKIASGFVGAAEELEKPASFDVKRFADYVRTLFKEVQRGLEIRIARIIGDLEGTLACDGMIHLKK